MHFATILVVVKQVSPQTPIYLPASLGKFFCLLAIVNRQDQQFTVAKRHKKYILFYHLVGFCGREKEIESEKEINKKMNSIWLMVKIRPLMQGML